MYKTFVKFNALKYNIKTYSKKQKITYTVDPQHHADIITYRC